MVCFSLTGMLFCSFASCSIVNKDFCMCVYMLCVRVCANVAVDTGAMSMSSKKAAAGQKQKSTLSNHFLRRKMARLRRAGCLMFQSHPLIDVLHRIEREVECERLALRSDRRLNADFGECVHNGQFFRLLGALSSVSCNLLG